MAPLPLDAAPTGGEDHDDGSFVSMMTASDDGDADLRMTVEEAYEAVHRMKPRVAAVMRLYYQQGWLDREIAEFLGVDDSRVCQIRGQGHDMMRGLLSLDLLFES